VTLADLKLNNHDAYLEGVETGAIRRLEGFSTAKRHTVPKTIAASVSAWVERLMKDDLTAELDELRAQARAKLGLARADTNVEWGDGGGTLDTPHFRFNVLCDQDPTDPANYRVRRQLELRDGWEACGEAIDGLFIQSDLARLIVDIESMPSAYEDIANALDALATANGGKLDEDTAKKRLTYSQGDITLRIDLKKGEVQLSFAGCAGLEIVERARATGLGWREPSPMLPVSTMLPPPAS
jgi:hypothetical protein